jgi:lipopolysaccharide heptosyltransferase II
MVNVNLIKFVDRTKGAFLCLILSLFSKKKEIDTKKSKKILFIQLWGIGETILTLPAIKAVKNKFRNAEIYILATDRNKVVYESAQINLEIIPLSLNPFSILKFIIYAFKKFDIVVDMEEYLNTSSIISYFAGKQRVGFSHGIRSKLYNKTVPYNDKKHCAETFLDLARAVRAEYREKKLVKLRYGRNEEEKIKNILPKLPKNSKLIGIVAGSAESAKSRMWPKENYAKLSNELIKENKALIFLGTKEEKQIADSIISQLSQKNRAVNLAGEISVKELFCLIEQLDLLITNDTGPLHVASAQKTKCIGLFGPNTPIRFGPYGNKAIAIYHKESCEFSPCINVHLGQVPDCLYKKNSKDYQKCMKSISVEEVKKAVDKLI